MADSTPAAQWAGGPDPEMVDSINTPTVSDHPAGKHADEMTEDELIDFRAEQLADLVRLADEQVDGDLLGDALLQLCPTATREILLVAVCLLATGGGF